MKILALDSSAVSASAAICDDNKILGEFYTNTGFTHSQTLMPMVESLLNTTQTKLTDIDLFAVCKGPGSFTGLRIGISCIKGMSMALDKPCVGISTLECIAQGGINCKGIICCVMDARCNQVYNALFKSDGKTLTRLCDDRAIALSDLRKELESFCDTVYLFGDGAYVAHSFFCNDKYVIPSAVNMYQKASSLALCAQIAYNNGVYTSASQLIPNYLRLPQAERELNNKKQLNK
ncbi:MAG: tRNA (adenosine(37)-N6)-threonylcarbamoyltransferase complex dimerization subunit type 1 TsaB [Clostridiales bacterium]|nr:tRNA (adenosine(37)-N6)-threonylcarbamoyltransferase complex dimerization subunit type 1 TsaB [Clostridiales bacterium]